MYISISSKMFVPLRYNKFYRFTTGVWQKNIEKEYIRKKRPSIFNICFMAAIHPLFKPEHTIRELFIHFMTGIRSKRNKF